MAKSESFNINGEDLLKKIKQLVEEGNIRRLMNFPLTVGVVGALLAPVLAAVGAVAALVTECTVTVEREETGKTEKPMD